MTSGAALDAAGWLLGVARLPSPNADERPPDAAIDLLVLHSISLPAGEYGGPAILELFTNRLDPDAHPSYATLQGLRVSAHFLVRRDGGVVQFVPCSQRAWHAGVSCFEGRQRCNDFSIGVELEGLEGLPFEDAQYDALGRLASTLADTYPLAAVAAHSEIAPGRKGDPGAAFDWTRFLSSIQGRLRRMREGV